MFLATHGILRSITRGFVDKFSFVYDGALDYIDAGSDSSLNWGSGNGSVSLWFKTSHNETGVGDLLMKGGFSTGGKTYAIFMNSSNEILFAIDDNVSLRFVKSSSSLNDGLWHHVVGQRDGSTLRLFIDGSIDDTLTGITTGNIDSSNPLLIGAGTNATNNNVGNFFSGKINEPAVFNYALTSTEVSNMYSSGIATDISSLNPITHLRAEKGSWNGSSWNITDIGSGGNNATSNNMVEASRSTDVP